MTPWIKFAIISLAAHAMLAVFMAGAPKQTTSPKLAKVQVRVVAKKPAPVEIIEEKPKVDKPKPKPPKPKKEPKKNVNKSERKPSKKPNQNRVEPLQGLSKESVSKNSKGISAPVGNTLMIEDTGKRVDPDAVEALDADLSAEAKLILSTIKRPEYTSEAQDVGLEGRFIVDIFVDENGNVVEAEFADKIGYGMDDRLMAAARQAKYIPRKNRYGKSIAGWTSITFDLRSE